MMRWLVAGMLVFLWSTQASGLELHGHIGLGKGIIRNQLGAHEQFERLGSLGVSKRFGVFYAKAETGGYLAYGVGRRHSWYAGGMFGAQVDTPMDVYVNVGFGPGYLASPDSALSGHFQFLIELGTGVCGDALCIGGRWFHVSDAGITQPNRGLDAPGLHLTWRF